MSTSLEWKAAARPLPADCGLNGSSADKAVVKVCRVVGRFDGSAGHDDCAKRCDSFEDDVQELGADLWRLERV